MKETACFGQSFFYGLNTLFSAKYTEKSADYVLLYYIMHLSAIMFAKSVRTGVISHAEDRRNINPCGMGTGKRCTYYHRDTAKDAAERKSDGASF